MPQRAMRTRRAGFTLIEIVVAMTVGAIVLVGVRQAAVGVADLAHATLARARSVERAANGERLLRRLVAEMEPDSNSTGGLVGDRSRAAFDAWCDAPAGWQERCKVTLAVDADSGSAASRLVVSSTGGRTQVAIARDGELSLCYLLDARDGGRWRDDWDGRLALPLAVGVVSATDTLLVPVGVRE